MRVSRLFNHSVHASTGREQGLPLFTFTVSFLFFPLSYVSFPLPIPFVLSLSCFSFFGFLCQSHDCTLWCQARWAFLKMVTYIMNVGQDHVGPSVFQSEPVGVGRSESMWFTLVSHYFFSFPSLDDTVSSWYLVAVEIIRSGSSKLASFQI